MECMLEDDSSHVLQVLQVDIASELSGIRKDASSLALAVDAIMKARASDVQGVLQKCEEASLGMTRGAPLIGNKELKTRMTWLRLVR